MKCYYCDKEMTDDEIDWYHEHVPTCCSGRDCGCMGLPVEPPICKDCISPETEYPFEGDKLL